MEKNRVYISALLVAFTIGTGQGMATEDRPSQIIVQAAETGLVVFVKDPRMKNLDRLGFGGRAAIDDATLGRGFRIYTIPPQTILDEKVGLDFYAGAVPTTQWQFLVKAQGKATSLLTVDRMGDQWQTISMGSAGLAEQLERLMDAWPSSAGYDYRLIRIYQATSDFLAISQNSEVLGIIPMTSGRIAMGLKSEALNTTDLRSSEEISKNIRQTVRINMQSR
jgi:hypothetical protein